MNNSKNWKSVNGYDGLYEVSDIGEVRSLGRETIYMHRGTPTKRIFKPRVFSPVKNKYGYLTVQFNDLNRNKKTFKIHRLVADAFIPYKKGRLCVNHIDGNKENNSVSNLEWCSHSENTKHAYKNGLKKAIKEGDHYKSKKIINKDNGKIYNYIKEAAEDNNINKSTLTGYLNGSRKNKTSLVYYNE